MPYSDLSHVLERHDLPLPGGGYLQHPFPREPFTATLQHFVTEGYISGTTSLMSS